MTSRKLTQAKALSGLKTENVQIFPFAGFIFQFILNISAFCNAHVSISCWNLNWGDYDISLSLSKRIQQTGLKQQQTKQNKTATITFQQKYFFASNFNFSGCSHVCTLFTIKEQKKIGLWQKVLFCHTCWPCSWCHWSGHYDCTHSHVFVTFKLKQTRP